MNIEQYINNKIAELKSTKHLIRVGIIDNGAAREAKDAKKFFENCGITARVFDVKGNEMTIKPAAIRTVRECGCFYICGNKVPFSVLDVPRWADCAGIRPDSFCKNADEDWLFDYVSDVIGSDYFKDAIVAIKSVDNSDKFVQKLLRRGASVIINNKNDTIAFPPETKMVINEDLTVVTRNEGIIASENANKLKLLTIAKNIVHLEDIRTDEY